MYHEFMPITLKNDKVEKMAREVARLSGRNLTDAIGHALEDQLRQLNQVQRAPRTRQILMDIAQRCADLPDKDTRSPDEILGYDDIGGFSHGD